MFGLMTSSDLAATKSNNARRRVFYQYPTGKFPLMGLLSLMDEGEPIPYEDFGWWEDRFQMPFSPTAQANSAGPFTDTSGSSGAVGTDKTSAGWSASAGTTIRIKVTDATKFRVRDVILIRNAPGATSTYVDIQGIVDNVWTAYNTIDVRLTRAVSNALNGTTANSINVYYTGGASVEGGFSKLGGYTFPLKVTNYLQVTRTVVGPWSAKAIKVPQLFDKTGVYRDDLKKSHIRHMIGLELNAFWGVYGMQTVIDPDDGVAKPEYTSGGIMDFLRQWELGTTGNGARVTYRPGGSDITSSSWLTEDLKRIINLNGATVTRKQFNRLIQMAFRYTADTQFEKLVCCGQGFLAVFNEFAERNSIKVVDINSKEDTYGMQMTKWTTSHGDLYFKVHPLFTENPMTNYSAMILDMGSLKFHTAQDRDSQLLTNRQANDFDGRKDEILTECGLELNFPERFMYIDNLGGITV